jgi:hypothetical protein
MDFAGWPPGLVLDDADWLLADGPARVREDEQRLAADAVLSLWEKEGRPPGLLTQIEAEAMKSAAMAAVVQGWLRPPEKSPELLQSESDFQSAKAQREQRDAEREQSWVDFVESVRNSPSSLGDLSPPSDAGVDGRLVDLWQLLSEAHRKDSHYAISSIAPLVDLIGPEAGRAFTREMRRMWRGWVPTLRSSRPPDERNQIRRLDCMGITGVSIEAATDPAWATKLTEAEAIRAAAYATLEINGLPGWTHDLAQAWPSAVQQVLAIELVADLDNPNADAHRPMLDYVDRAGADIARLMAPTVWRELQAREQLVTGALQPALSILRQGMPDGSRQEIYDLAWRSRDSGSRQRLMSPRCI